MAYNNLLHPELIEAIPLTGARTAERLSTLVSEYASRSTVHLPGVSVVVRALNEVGTLDNLLEDISRQRFCGDVEIIVLDNESRDETVAVARSHDATVETIKRDDFTYPRSLNRALEVSSFDIVFTTVGHALLSNMQTVNAVATQLNRQDTAGVFARTLPGRNASRSERAVAIGNIAYMKPPARTDYSKISALNLGLFAAQNIGIRKEAWLDLGGFDERFESGGDDTDFAIRAINSGARIIEDQVVAVHHTHGLSFENYAKQWWHWAKTLRGPQDLDFVELQSRRPDLDFTS